jgi:hypothetical protein
MQENSWTAALHAAANGHADTVKALVAAGANVSATTTVRGHHVSRVCGGPQRTRCIGLVVWPSSPVALLGTLRFEEIPRRLGCLFGC